MLSTETSKIKIHNISLFFAHLYLKSPYNDFLVSTMSTDADSKLTSGHKNSSKMYPSFEP